MGRKRRTRTGLMVWGGAVPAWPAALRKIWGARAQGSVRCRACGVREGKDGQDGPQSLARICISSLHRAPTAACCEHLDINPRKRAYDLLETLVGWGHGFLDALVWGRQGWMMGTSLMFLACAIYGLTSVQWSMTRATGSRANTA